MLRFKAFPHSVIVDLFKLKAFADSRVNVTQSLKRIENIVEKGENAGCQHFLHFPQCFQTTSFSGSFKVRI